MRAIASALALAAVSWAGSANAATGDLPDLGIAASVGSLPTGGMFIVRPAAGAPVAAIELWYRAPSTGFESKAVPGVARMAAQAVAASKPIVGDSLGQIVEAVGGRLAITVYSDSIAIAATVPTSAARSVTKAMTTAYFAPVLTDDGFHSAERDVASEAFVSSFDPEALVRDAVFATLFTSGPQHYSALGSPREVAAVTSADVKSFATRAFRAGNATLVISGDVDAQLTQVAASGRPGDSAAEVATAPVIASAAGPVFKNGSPSGGGYGWVGPAIADEREATAMDFIADYLFRAEGGVVTRQVADAFPDAFVVGQFITLHDPGVMFVAYSGKDPAALRGLVDAGFGAVRKPLAPETFAAALASFKYHIFSDLQTPTQLADNFGWYAVEGAPAYAPGANGDAGAYFKAADSLSPEFVAAVAQKYLSEAAAANVTLRQPAAPSPKASAPAPQGGGK